MSNKAARRAKYEAKLKAASIAGAAPRSASPSQVTVPETVSIDDIEALSGEQPVETRRDCPTAIRNYVVELEAILRAKLAERTSRGERLQHVDFSTATSGLNKTRRYPTYGKCRIIHVYRTLVHEGILEHEQQIADLLVRKLGRSGYGGVNLSVFIPPGHSAPVWEVKAMRCGDTLTLSVTKQRTVYTLCGYVDYSHRNSGATIFCSPTYRADKIGEKDMTLVATRTSTITALFELVLESVHGTDQMEEQQEYAGTLKGTEPLKTCTFGCVYCPTEVDAEGEQVNPKSYLTHESGVSRALRNRYSTVDQVHDRIRSLVNMGHNVSKVFVRCVGGTWSVLTRNARQTFIRDVLHALNTVEQPLRSPLSLEEEQVLNERAYCRAVEICVEDHPKMLSAAGLRENRMLGITALELGVQTTDDEVHRLTRRDSTRAQIVEKTQLAKEFGFKVMAHIMPDLPGSSPELDRQVIDDILCSAECIRIRDISGFAKLVVPVFCAVVMMVWGWLACSVCSCLLLLGVEFVERFCSHVSSFEFDFDRFKLYPTMVLEFSELKSWYKEGKFTPYFESDPEALLSVIQHFMESVKPYQRVERVVRDIPASRDPNKPNYVVAGIHITNAQQIVEARMPTKCVCLRSREIRAEGADAARARLYTHRYYANNGEEWFLSFETRDRTGVYGFLKLRFNHSRDLSHLPPEIRAAAIIRWLQVYGRAIAVGEEQRRQPGKLHSDAASFSQHLGFGRRLMDEAERIARRRGVNRIADISGIGVREYYRRLGYRLEGSYMIKDL